jgi:serine/threonine-protein kinase
VTRPLVGRADEVTQLRGLLTEAAHQPVRLHVTGEPGAGKTRLLKELSYMAEEEGDVVVAATPHPTRAPVAYGAARTLLASLLDVDANQLAGLAEGDGVFADPLVRAGVAEAAAPKGLPGVARRDRAAAVAAALATATHVAAERAKSGRVVMIIDDLHVCDGLTQHVVRELPSQLGDTSTLIATAGFHARHKIDGASTIVLHGLDHESATRFMEGTAEEPGEDAALATTSRLMLPLYLEQVQALGAQLGGDDSLPPRLADAVAQRLDRLDLPARRIVQAAAVLGDRCDLLLLKDLTRGEDMTGLEELSNQQLVRITDGDLEIGHPFIRDLIEASIPAEARRNLHERALALTSQLAAPLEVRAEHAYRAGEPMSALMILERMGDQALGCGDVTASVLAFRRALELARREMLETGDVMLEGAIVTFSRKLGDALQRSGDVTGADGVLREALDLAGPHSVERARMLLVLGRVAAARDRRRDAARLLGQALEVASTQRETETEARIQAAMAQLRREEGDHAGAGNAYARATELLEGDLNEVAPYVELLTELGEVLLELSDTEEAQRRLERARDTAEAAGHPSLVATAVGTLGALAEIGGDSATAAARYRDAARLAAEAGDAPAHDRWRTAASVLA